MENLRGRCLMATPQVKDPHFVQSVVLIYEQTAKGIAGVVLNKKSQFNTRDVAERHGYTLTTASDPIYSGGPVNPNAILMLHTSEWHSSNTMLVNSDLAVSSDDIMMMRYLNGDQPKNLRFFSGSAVWSVPQLKNEIKNNHWLTCDLTVAQLFSYNSSNQWQLALESAARSAVDTFM